jgi:hypothetical protein
LRREGGEKQLSRFLSRPPRAQNTHRRGGQCCIHIHIHPYPLCRHSHHPHPHPHAPAPRTHPPAYRHATHARKTHGRRPALSHTTQTNTILFYIVYALCRFFVVGVGCLSLGRWGASGVRFVSCCCTFTTFCFASYVFVHSVRRGAKREGVNNITCIST